MSLEDNIQEKRIFSFSNSYQL